MTASAHDVAAAIRLEQPNLGEMKLHKLLYYCQGYHLAVTGQPLFRETIDAWPMGPVCSDVLDHEHKFGPARHVTPLDNGELNTVGYVLSHYGHKSGGDLSQLTHQEQPWLSTKPRLRRRASYQSISLQAMRDFFVERIESELADSGFPYESAAVTRILAEARERVSLPPTSIDDREKLLARMRG